MRVPSFIQNASVYLSEERMSDSPEHGWTMIGLDFYHLCKDLIVTIEIEGRGSQVPIASAVAANKAHSRSAANTNIN